MDNIRSSLVLEKLIFEKIIFTRIGFKSDSEIKFNIRTEIAQRNDNEIYRVALNLTGEKPSEYNLEISLVGFFSFEEGEEISVERKEKLISSNTVAIMMPYLRSQLTLLTAQPDVDPIVLPTFNISKMIENSTASDFDE